jgi:hypothetical protein
LGPKAASAVVCEHPGVLSTETLLARLRGGSAARPLVDPGLAGGLRDWLEDALVPALAGLPPGSLPVRVTKDAVNRVLACEAHFLSRAGTARIVTLELARGVMVDALFRQWVTTGVIADPWADAMAAVECAGDEAVVRFVKSLDTDSRDGLCAEVREHAAGIESSWPLSSPAWLSRTQERLEVPLAGGRLVLNGVVDLAFGAPSNGRASVCLVELKSGARRLEHRGDVHFYALLETLRSGAPPFRVATYYSSSGELDAEQVGEDVLIGALQRTLAGAERLCRLAAGAAPARTANPLCTWCDELPGCEPGRDRALNRASSAPGDPGTDDRIWGDEQRRVEGEVG